jgi:hypothetical protein
MPIIDLQNGPVLGRALPLPAVGGEGWGVDVPYRIVGMMYSAPARMPVGQREVTVFSLV